MIGERKWIEDSNGGESYPVESVDWVAMGEKDAAWWLSKAYTRHTKEELVEAGVFEGKIILSI